MCVNAYMCMWRARWSYVLVCVCVYVFIFEYVCERVTFLFYDKTMCPKKLREERVYLRLIVPEG